MKLYLFIEVSHVTFVLQWKNKGNGAADSQSYWTHSTRSYERAKYKYQQDFQVDVHGII